MVGHKTRNYLVCNCIHLELTGVYASQENTVAETVEVRRETGCIQGAVLLMFSMIAGVFCMKISISMECMFFFLARNSKVNRTQTNPIL